LSVSARQAKSGVVDRKYRIWCLRQVVFEPRQMAQKVLGICHFRTLVVKSI
jgi:hypothetical protein